MSPNDGERLPPPHFEAAGSDAELRKAYVVGQVESRRRSADDLMNQARQLLQAPSEIANELDAEELARRSLKLYRSALDWAEDTDLEDEAHQAMDDAGRWVCETFGCHLERSGDEYFRTCPVDLGHNRIGFSIGGRAARRICSLCGEDVSECEHLPHTSYLVPGGPADLGWCRVCLEEECEHNPEARYSASVVSRIVELEIEEISLVSRPAHPEARIHRLSVDSAELREALGPDFVPGMEVRCHKCLDPCGGLIRHNLPHG